MKKRKSPIVLLTTLAVMISVAFGLQFASSKTGGAGAQPPPPEISDAKAVGTPRAPEAQASVASGVKAALGAPAGGPPAGGPGGEGGPGRMGPPGSTGPMVLNPARPMGKPEKPKPNTSSTSAHWYDKDSAMANEK